MSPTVPISAASASAAARLIKMSSVLRPALDAAEDSLK